MGGQRQVSNQQGSRKKLESGPLIVFSFSCQDVGQLLGSAKSI